MGYTTLNKDEKEEEKKVLILFTPTFLPFGQEVSLAQRARSIPIFSILQTGICQRGLFQYSTVFLFTS